MTPNLAPVQGRHAVTPQDGARVGSRGRRFVTSVLGRLWASCSPASRPVRGVLPLDWDRRRRVTPVETTSQEAWPGAEPWGSAVPLARTVVERRWASAPGKARAASAGAASTASVGVPSSFSSFILERAQSADRDGAGHHRQRHLTKIGAESEAFVTFITG